MTRSTSSNRQNDHLRRFFQTEHPNRGSTFIAARRDHVPIFDPAGPTHHEYHCNLGIPGRPRWIKNCFSKDRPSINVQPPLGVGKSARRATNRFTGSRFDPRGQPIPTELPLRQTIIHDPKPGRPVRIKNCFPNDRPSINVQPPLGVWESVDGAANRSSDLRSDPGPTVNSAPF